MRAVIGQGVFGTAAAYAVKNIIAPAKLSHNSQAMTMIQHQLLKDDAFLINLHNDHQIDSDPKCCCYGIK